MDLSLFDIVILAVVQGVAEFLPISSSGHVVVLAHLLGSGGTATDLDVADVNIVLHAGTLLSILLFYWQRIWQLLGNDRRTLGLVVLGTLPAVIVGVPLKLAAGEILSNALLAGCMLVVTGFMLLVSRWQTKGEGTYETMSWKSALLIGASQAVAILPGISRSGSTIVTGMHQKLSPQAAATFSFLLAIPAIAGAACIEIALLIVRGSEGDGTPTAHLLLGAFIAFVVGYFALRCLVALLQRGHLHWFAWWCLPVGMLVIGWQLL